MSLARTSFDKREFLLPEMLVDLKADPDADAGVIGDLNTLKWAASGGGGENFECLLGDAIGDDCLFRKETCVDSPTQPGTFSATNPSYSKPEVLCKTGRPRLLTMGFHGSLN